MPDFGKSIRSARTTFPGGNIGGGLPQERSQLIAQEVHQHRSASEGLEGLNGALDSFFSLASQGIDQVRQGLEVGQRIKIERDNAAQKRQAAGDATLGKDMDPALAGDLDYYDAFRAVRSQRDGFQAAQDFQAWYLSDWLPANPTGDLANAREKWAADNLTGSDDPDYEGQLLATFFGHSDGLVSQHVETAYKYQTQKGVQLLGEAIDAAVVGGTLTPEGIQTFFDQARALDPLNATEAPARVMSALLASSDNHPSKAMQVSNVLMQPGTGMNGKSFAESWPGNFADFQSKAEAAYSSINNLREAQALDGLKTQFRAAKSPEDYAQLLVDITKFHHQFGALSATETLESNVAAAMAKLDETAAEQASAAAWMAGDPQGDPSYLKDHWADFLASQAGERNVLNLDLSTGAQLVQDLRGIVPTQLREQLSAVVADPRDPAAQGRAFQFVSVLAENAGLDYATSYLSESAKTLYASVHARMTVTDEPLESILAQVNEAAAGIEDWNAGWDKITGKAKAEEWRPALHKAISSNLDALLGDPGITIPLIGVRFGGKDVVLPPGLLDQIEEAARQHALLATATGQGWEVGVKNAMTMLAGNAEVVPGADGQMLLRLGVDDTQLTYLDENDQLQTRVRFGRAVFNDITKAPVDTVEVFRDQSRQMQRTFPWIVPGGDVDAIALRPAKADTSLGRYGLFGVEVDNRPVVFYPGQEIAWSLPGVGAYEVFDGVDKTLVNPSPVIGTTTIPEDPTELEVMLQGMPEGFHLVPVDFPGVGVGYRLAYRPNFGDQRGVTLDDQEAAFQPTDPTEQHSFWSLPNGQVIDLNRLVP